MCNDFKVNKPVSKAAMMVRLQRQLVLLSDKNEGGARTAHETCCLSSRPDHVTLPSTPAPHIKNTFQYFIYTFFHLSDCNLRTGKEEYVSLPVLI